MDERRKEAILKALRDEYGITTHAQLRDAINNMEKLDITQFVHRLPGKEESYAT